jgi:hypothetical protein
LPEICAVYKYGERIGIDYISNHVEFQLEGDRLYLIQKLTGECNYLVMCLYCHKLWKTVHDEFSIEAALCLRRTRLEYQGVGLSNYGVSM